jgi:hypothetical protein
MDRQTAGLRLERGVVKPSNDERSAPIGNGFMPLGRQANTINPPNHGPGGDHRNGSFSLAGGASPITERSNDDWRVGTSSQAEMAAAVEPGRGAVPVNPFRTSGSPAEMAMPIADTAKAGPR